MKFQTTLALLAVSALIPCPLAQAQQAPPPTQARIQIPDRLRPAMEATFKYGTNYFIWLLQSTNTFRAERAGMPFPHALIECYCLGNPQKQNPKFKSTIEMVTATSKAESAEHRLGYADATLDKDAAWWKDAQGGKPVHLIFAYVPQDRVLVGTNQVKLYLTSAEDKESHVPVSNVLRVNLQIPE